MPFTSLSESPNCDFLISCTIFKGLWSPWKTLQVSGTINDDRGTELTIVEANPKYVIPCISLE